MKKILCLFSFIVTVFVAQAQGRPMNGQNRPPMRDRQGMEMPPPPQRPMTKQQREKLELFKIQFVTKKLDLTPAEAEKFWPLYNEQKDASQSLMQTAKEDEIAFQEAMLTIRKKFKKDLSEPGFKSRQRTFK